MFVFIVSAIEQYIANDKGPGRLNRLGSWITKQLIQAYHQYGVGSPPAL